MAFTPTTYTLTPWVSPITIAGTDLITNLDESFNAIITTDTNSFKNWINSGINTTLSGYLTTNFNAMNADLTVTTTAIDATISPKITAEVALQLPAAVGAYVLPTGIIYDTTVVLNNTWSSFKIDNFISVTNYTKAQTDTQITNAVAAAVGSTLYQHINLGGL